MHLSESFMEVLGAEIQSKHRKLAAKMSRKDELWWNWTRKVLEGCWRPHISLDMTPNSRRNMAKKKIPRREKRSLK